MVKFLDDCAEVSEKVKKGDLGKGNIEQIVEDYNICLSKVRPAATPEPISLTESLNKTAQLEAIQNLKDKIKEQNFSTKEDALDILRDIETKVDRNESVSNYLLEGLQSTLKDQSSISEDLDKLIALFKK